MLRVQYLKLVLSRNSKCSHHENTQHTFAFVKHFLRQILYFRVHSYIFASFLFGTAIKTCVWDRGVPSLQVSDWGWEVKIVVEVVVCWGGYPLLEAPQQCEAASCPRHTIVVPLTCAARLPVFTAVSCDYIQHISHQSTHWRAELHVSAPTTCSSVWLYESQQLKD